MSSFVAVVVVLGAGLLLGLLLAQAVLDWFEDR